MAVGNMKIGGSNPVVIQSMTNTPTQDVEATVQQILELHQAGAQIVRITVNDIAAAQAVPLIIDAVRKTSDIPLVGDFHFNGNILLKKVPECAQSLDKYRINPGNASDENFKEMIEIALKYNKPIRIGVNGGSLDPHVLEDLMSLNALIKSPLSSDKIFVQAMVKSALNACDFAHSLGMQKDKIIVSVKVSEVGQMIEAAELLHQKSDYAIHLGLTEAGGGDFGTIASSVALGILLQKGIGNTIRVSLTPAPGVPRSQEVEVCKMILQSLGLKNFKPRITSCPGCGRTTSTFFQELAKTVNQQVDEKINAWKKLYPGVENLKIAVMGCVVNGPGESKNADIGISLPGTTEAPMAPVYIEGSLYKNLKGNDIDQQFLKILETYISQKFSSNKK